MPLNISVEYFLNKALSRKLVTIMKPFENLKFCEKSINNFLFIYYPIDSKKLKNFTTQGQKYTH